MLTKSQKKTLDFITSYIDQHTLSPTLDEIAKGIGIQSKGTVSRYIDALINKGLIEKKKCFSRSIALVHHREEKSTPSIPLLGTIAAGSPIEAISDNDETDMATLLPGNNLYMLKVKGQSMVEVGIHDGDYIIIEKTDVAKNGDIVVALIDQAEVTLKRISFFNDGYIHLSAENKDMPPMRFHHQRVRIQGTLKAQLRTHTN